MAGIRYGPPAKRESAFSTLRRALTRNGMIQNRPWREKMNLRQAREERKVSRSDASGTMYWTMHK